MIYMKAQHVVIDNNVQHPSPSQAFEEGYIPNKDGTHSSSPLMAGSSADITMALVPPSPSLSAENITNDNDCKLTTLVRIQDLQYLTV